MAIVRLLEQQADLPSAESTKSYWHKEPSETLLGHRTTQKLPAAADVVVVGSGITGAFAARELVGGGRSVLMLEAREACWGATGRVSFILFSKLQFGISALNGSHGTKTERPRTWKQHQSLT